MRNYRRKSTVRPSPTSSGVLSLTVMPTHEIQGERIAAGRPSAAQIDTAVTPAPGQAAPVARRRTMPPQLPAVRILIVDDDKAICEYMQTLLERDGFQLKGSSAPRASEGDARTGATTPTTLA